MKDAGVIGWPVEHSRSPHIHTYWLRKHKIKADYHRCAVAPDAVARFIRELPQRGWAGVNVTVPHKEVVYQVLHRHGRLEESARRVGAVNLVVVEEDGSLTGKNTDGEGFMQGLNETGWQKGMGALVLGAGGAARAVVGVLREAGESVVVASRKQEQGEQLTKDVGGKWLAWEEREKALGGVGVLINATPLGMEGQQPLALDIATLRPQATVADLVYVPRQTPLLQAARARGLRTMEGLAMLLHQAVPAFAAWWGVCPRVCAGVRAHVAEAL